MTTWINLPLIRLAQVWRSIHSDGTILEQIIHSSWSQQRTLATSSLAVFCLLISEMGWLAGKEREGEILRYRVLSRVRLSGLPQSPLHTAGLTAAQYGKNLMPPGTQPIWMLRLPLSQAQVVQKNCSGLIPEALQIHTAGISAYSLLGGGAL